MQFIERERLRRYQREIHLLAAEAKVMLVAQEFAGRERAMLEQAGLEQFQRFDDQP